MGLLIGSAPAARADVAGGFPDRLGPTASVSVGAGYSFFARENGGVSVLGIADLGWFVTDRLAVLAGATREIRFGDEDLFHTMFRLGVEYRLDPRHYLRVSAGRSSVTRERDEVDGGEGVEHLGDGEGVLLVAGVPAGSWSWGELSFQVTAGGAYHHGDDTRSRYAGFVATCLELAVR